MVHWLPPEYREAALYIPTVHYFEMIRGGFFGAAAKAHYDMTYIAMFCLGLTFFALVVLRYVRKWVIVQ
jgi:capsular polysaccharide transport system permease protein